MTETQDTQRTNTEAAEQAEYGAVEQTEPVADTRAIPETAAVDAQKQKEPTKESSKEPSKSQKPKKSVGREILEWVISILVAVALAFLIRTFLFEPIRVEGSSMLETLHNNEYVIVTKPEYLRGTPQRFDVVICHYPQRTENFVKRLVGLPGDVVEMKDGMLSVNGVVYPEQYLSDMNRPVYEGAWKLGDEDYFVLGDNRANSNDSHLIGSITRDMIVGHVRFVVWPLTKMRTVQ